MKNPLDSIPGTFLAGFIATDIFWLIMEIAY